jgi:hypothetical protein
VLLVLAADERQREYDDDEGDDPLRMHGGDSFTLN